MVINAYNLERQHWWGKKSLPETLHRYKRSKPNGFLSSVLIKDGHPAVISNDRLLLNKWQKKSGNYLFKVPHAVWYFYLIQCEGAQVPKSESSSLRIGTHCWQSFIAHSLRKHQNHFPAVYFMPNCGTFWSHLLEKMSPSKKYRDWYSLACFLDVVRILRYGYT